MKKQIVTTIDRDIPIVSERGRKLLYPFDKMDVNTSFVLAYSKRRFNAAKTSAYGYGARHNMKFQASSPIEHGKRIIRIWRIK